MTLPYLVFSEQKRNQMVHYFAKFAEVRDIKEIPEVSKLNGWIIKNVEIFKVGTWKKRTYTADHLQEMADNFRTLKDAGTYDPVFKKNHSERVEDQVGWIYDVRRDGDVLLADLHITDWSAYDKIQEGTWKNLSSEIYLPALALDEFGINGHVLRGVAIVSVPQVKGLKGLVLNSEILEEEKGGVIVNREQVEALLKKWNKYSEDELKAFTDEEVFAKFSEVTEGIEIPAAAAATPPVIPAVPAAGQANFSENGGQGFVVMSQKDILELAQSINGKDKQNIDLFSEVVKLKKESKENKVERKVEALMKAGKVTPAEKAGIISFSEKLDETSFDAYFATLESRSPVAEFGELGGQEPATDDEEIKAALAAMDSQGKIYE
jgi:phage I-like protein